MGVRLSLTQLWQAAAKHQAQGRGLTFRASRLLLGQGHPQGCMLSHQLVHLVTLQPASMCSLHNALGRRLQAVQARHERLRTSRAARSACRRWRAMCRGSTRARLLCCGCKGVQRLWRCFLLHLHLCSARGAGRLTSVVGMPASTFKRGPMVCQATEAEASAAASWCLPTAQSDLPSGPSPLGGVACGVRSGEVSLARSTNSCKV